MKPIHYIAFLLLLLTPVGALAQSSIETAIVSLEKSKTVTNEVFSERRDPSTRAVIRSNRMFNFDNKKMASKIIEAIKKERSKAVAFQMSTTPGQEVYTISFQDSKGLYTKYVLARDGRGGWVLAIDKTMRIFPKSKSGKDRSDLGIDTLDLLETIFGYEDLIKPTLMIFS